MSGLVVDTSKCVGCRRCVRVCGNDGIEVTDRKAHVLDGCIACGMCVDACPVGALSIEKDGPAGADLAAYHDIWVFAQVDGQGSVLPVALELVGKGRELACARGCRLVAVLGEGAGAADANAELLLAAGADEVLRCRDERLATADSEVFATWLTALAGERKPEVILYGATDFGRELAPRVAVLLQTGLTADCTILEMDTEKGLLQQTRPAFGGNLMATIVCPAHRPQMATVRPGVFSVPEAVAEGVAHVADAAARIVDVALDAAVRPVTTVTDVEPKETEGSITDAEVLVVVGRGIGSKKAIPQMERLAELLGKKLGCSAAVGCTRPLVGSGWMKYPTQIGQTGVSVAPKLMVSIGVSGAIQHTSGIGGTKTIVAINEDPDAPIFGLAKYKVVGDCHKIVPALIERLEAELS